MVAVVEFSGIGAIITTILLDFSCLSASDICAQRVWMGSKPTVSCNKLFHPLFWVGKKVGWRNK